MNNDFIIQDGVLTSYIGNDIEITIPNGVHTIGDSAFKGLFKIEKVILPNTVTTLGKNAFKGCKKLYDINFPNSLVEIGDYAFHRCHSLKSAILPDSLTNLGGCAFLYCDNLEIVSIMGVKKLKIQTFANDTNLQELRLNKDLDTSNLNDDILTGCVKISKVVLSDGSTYIIENLIKAINSNSDTNPIVKAIAKGVYKTMQLEDSILYKFNVNLKSFELPEGITCIEKSCFYDRKGIISVTLPKSLERIKSQAFKNCINLEEIRLLNCDINIDADAFKGCNNLIRIILPDGESYNIDNYLLNEDIPKIVREIQEQTLSDFYISGTKLISYRGNEERVTVPNGITIIEENCFINNEAIGRIILPNTVREIREFAFKGCLSMQTITLSDNLVTIERSAFENCFKLIHIELPQKLTKIGVSAFKRCLKLNSILLNDGLKSIEDMAFYGCKSLKSIDIPKCTKVIGDLVFFNSGINYDIQKNTSIERFYSKNDIPPYQFANDSNIKELKISKPCIIGSYTFSSCQNLETVSLDNPFIVVEENAFEKCINLKTVYCNAKSIGKGTFSFCRNLESITIKSIEYLEDEIFLGCTNLKNVNILDNTITKIGNNSFDECINLEKFNFNGIQSIGERAFARCESLKSISISQGIVNNHAFEDCCNLQEISISSEVILKSGVFSSDTNVTTIILDNETYEFSKYLQSINTIRNNLPYRVQEIISDIYSCFKVTERLEIIEYTGNSKSVSIPKDIVALGDELFRDCIQIENVNIPSNVKSIGERVFVGTSWLNNLKKSKSMVIINNLLVDASSCDEYIEIPINVIRICGWAFANNYSIREVKFLNDKITIDDYAFRNCINLKRVTLSDNTTYVLDSINVIYNDTLPSIIKKIFSDCINCFKTSSNGNLIESTGNIPDLVFTDGITSIEDNVYKDCNLLQSIKLSKDTISIGNNAFENSKWLKIVENAISIQRVGNFAFSGCQRLEKVEFSNKLQSIGKRAFEHCCNLKEIIIPQGITEIYERTFFRCKSLKCIVLPSTLKVIHKEAFAFCSSLERVIFLGDLELIEDKAFAWCENLKECDLPNNTKLGKEIFFNGVQAL